MPQQVEGKGLINPGEMNRVAFTGRELNPAENAPFVSMRTLLGALQYEKNHRGKSGVTIHIDGEGVDIEDSGEQTGKRLRVVMIFRTAYTRVVGEDDKLIGSFTFEGVGNPSYKAALQSKTGGSLNEEQRESYELINEHFLPFSGDEALHAAAEVRHRRKVKPEE